MKKKLSWLGHGCWLVTIDKTSFLFDPYFQTNTAPCQPEQVQTDYIVLTHGHGDHMADAVDIAKRNNAPVFALAEIAGWLESKGVKKTEPMNIGGSVRLPIHSTEFALQLTMTPALHSSTMPDGRSGGCACGWLLSIVPTENILRPFSDLMKESYTIYFAGDTGFFPGMKTFGEYGLDAAILPIGDRYTMGPAQSLDAIRLLDPIKVLPSHFGTWPPINQDIENWSEAVRQYTKAEPVILKPGQETEL